MKWGLTTIGTSNSSICPDINVTLMVLREAFILPQLIALIPLDIYLILKRSGPHVIADDPVAAVSPVTSNTFNIRSQPDPLSWKLLTWIWDQDKKRPQ